MRGPTRRYERVLACDRAWWLHAATRRTLGGPVSPSSAVSRGRSHGRSSHVGIIVVVEYLLACLPSRSRVPPHEPTTSEPTHPRSFQRIPTGQEKAFIERLSPNHYRINVGFVPNMRVPGIVYVNDQLDELLFDELKAAVDRGNTGGFLPAVKQIANVAALPGVVSHSVAMPDVHSGYGFCIGNVAAMDMSDPEAVCCRLHSTIESAANTRLFIRSFIHSLPH